MFFKVIRHSPVSWEMMEDLDGIEPYQVVTHPVEVVQQVQKALFYRQTIQKITVLDIIVFIL